MYLLQGRWCGQEREYLDQSFTDMPHSPTFTPRPRYSSCREVRGSNFHWVEGISTGIESFTIYMNALHLAEDQIVASAVDYVPERTLIAYRALSNNGGGYVGARHWGELSFGELIYIFA